MVFLHLHQSLPTFTDIFLVSFLRLISTFFHQVILYFHQTSFLSQIHYTICLKNFILKIWESTHDQTLNFILLIYLLHLFWKFIFLTRLDQSQHWTIHFRCLKTILKLSITQFFPLYHLLVNILILYTLYYQNLFVFHSLLILPNQIIFYNITPKQIIS